MLRRLVDYKKLSHEVANLLIEAYPHGYGDSDIIYFKNLKGEIIEAVEVKTEDTIYLVKISKSLSDFFSNFEDSIEKELETDAKHVLQDINSNVSELQNPIDNDTEDTDSF